MVTASAAPRYKPAMYPSPRSPAARKKGVQSAGTVTEAFAPLNRVSSYPYIQAFTVPEGRSSISTRAHGDVHAGFQGDGLAGRDDIGAGNPDDNAKPEYLICILSYEDTYLFKYESLEVADHPSATSSTTSTIVSARILP